jgi:hypothetical protein
MIIEGSATKRNQIPTSLISSHLISATEEVMAKRRIKRKSVLWIAGCVAALALLANAAGCAGEDVGLMTTDGGGTASPELSTQAPSAPSVPASPSETTSEAPSTAPPAEVSPSSSPSMTEDATLAPTDSAEPEPPSSPVAAATGTALATAQELTVKGRAPKTGYARDQFGEPWVDVDGNGCDTRNDILQRDLVDKTLRGDGCTVQTGTLNDPFTATVIAFTRGQGTSSLVQIDHVVALSDAWQKGAQQWTAETRLKFANDPLNLLAVDGKANQQKGDGDTATWLPSNKPFRCEYVARQVSVKAKYGLWATQAEQDAMVRVLSECPDQPLATDSGVVMLDTAGAQPLVDLPAATSAAPAPAPTTPAPGAPAPAAPAPAPAETTAPAQAPADVYYKNCDAVRAAGAAPLYKDQPGYSTKLDRDKDGVACE